uniref:Uncharacterized protein n=1 Tax=Bactrocera dorsalis TaxID=27457 RepID=A0A034WQ46_BACDO
MRFCILFALIVAIYAEADNASEQSAVPTQEQSAGPDVQPNSLLEDVDAGGEHAEETERTARSFGWGGYGGYGGFGGFGGYGYKRWGGYGGYGGHRGYGGYGGYGYRPHYAVVYRQPYYHGYGHKYWG